MRYYVDPAAEDVGDVLRAALGSLPQGNIVGNTVHASPILDDVEHNGKHAMIKG